MPHASCHTEPTFYEILGLTGRPSRNVSRQDVKAVYHRALLRYHPDKIKTSLIPDKQQLLRQDGELYTVDQITEAYNTLANPLKRAAYDKQLELSLMGTNRKYIEEKLHDGVEVLDLEDLLYDGDKNVWSRGCRCGDSLGYVLTEMELERESSEGETYVACKGCSLWIKVMFGTREIGHESDDEAMTQ